MCEYTVSVFLELDLKLYLAASGKVGLGSFLWWACSIFSQQFFGQFLMNTNMLGKSLCCSELNTYATINSRTFKDTIYDKLFSIISHVGDQLVLFWENTSIFLVRILNTVSALRLTTLHFGFNPAPCCWLTNHQSSCSVQWNNAFPTEKWLLHFMMRDKSFTWV